MATKPYNIGELAKQCGTARTPCDTTNVSASFADQDAAPCQHVQAMLERHIDEVDARVAELRTLRRNIEQLTGPRAKGTHAKSVCLRDHRSAQPAVRR